MINKAKKTQIFFFYITKTPSCRLKNLYITLFTMFTTLKLSKITITLKYTIHTLCSPYSKQIVAQNVCVSQQQLCNFWNGIETLEPCIQMWRIATASQMKFTFFYWTTPLYIQEHIFHRIPTDD